MKAILYLTVMTVKNKLLSLRNKPLLLIVYLLCAISFGAGVVYLLFSRKSINLGGNGDIRMLYAITAGFCLLFSYSSLAAGLTTGGTLFNMADVSLLFVSPVKPRKILIYGLVKQMGSTAFAALFILFQIPNLMGNFPIGLNTIYMLLFLYVVTIFFTQLIAIAVYIFSNGNEFKKMLVSGVVVLLCLFVATLVYMNFRESGDWLKALYKTMDSTAFGFVPVIGWSVMILKASVTSNILFFVIGLLLYFISTVLIIALLSSGEADYYEDVLISTESNFTKLQAVKEGKTRTVTRKVKVRENRMGIGKGFGASIFFYKHLLEVKRGSFLPYIDALTITSAILAGVFTKQANNPFIGYIVLCFMVYMQYFFTLVGRLSIEIKMPFIFLVPEKSLTKLIAVSLSNLIKPLIDGTIVFTIVYLISGTPVILNVFLAIAYMSTGFSFSSLTILNQRLLGGQPNKIISSFLGIGLFIAIMAPGIIASFVATLLLSEALSFLGLLPFILLNLIISAIIYLICGDIFERTECVK